MQRSGELSPGRIIGGKYLILRRIGSGGTGNVYEVRDLHLKKIWAMKFIRCQGSGRQAAFLELSRMRTFNHPRLPRIVDAFEAEDGNCIVMDFLEGKTLDFLLTDQKRQENFGKRDLIRWGIELCEALDYLHHCVPPVIYRDMKPGNVLLRPDRTVMLLDFGTTEHAGTPGYAAPEQNGGNGRADVRSDIYALGRTLYRLYEALQKKEMDDPKEGGKRKNLLQKMKRQKRKIGDRDFLRILLKACEVCPEKRFQSAVQMAEAFKRCGETELESGQKGWSRRSAALSCAAAFSLVCIVAAVPAVGGKTTSASTYGKAEASTRDTDGDTKPEDDEELEKEVEETEKGEEGKQKETESERLFEEKMRTFRGLLDFPEDHDAERKKEIEVCFEELCALDTGREDPYLLYISYLYKTGNLKRAAELFRKVSEQEEIEDNPNYQRLKIKLRNAGAL